MDLSMLPILPGAFCCANRWCAVVPFQAVPFLDRSNAGLPGGVCVVTSCKTGSSASLRYKPIPLREEKVPVAGCTGTEWQERGETGRRPHRFPFPVIPSVGCGLKPRRTTRVR